MQFLAEICGPDIILAHGTLDEWARLSSPLEVSVSIRVVDGYPWLVKKRSNGFVGKGPDALHLLNTLPGSGGYLLL